MAALPIFALARQGEPRVIIPLPGRSYSRPLVRTGATNVTLGGRQVMDTIAKKRRWTMSWNKLTDAQYDKIDRFWNGTMGPGPFEFYENTRPMVLVNIESLTDNPPYPDAHEAEMVLIEV